MDFGVFISGMIPKPWAADSEQRSFDQDFEIGVLADELGFGYVWMSEHHFLEEYCHSSSPELMLAALARATRNVRLGHGIVDLQPKMNHPIRVAERIASLDLLSHGRVEFGSGRGSGAMEWGGFETEEPETKANWEEALYAILAMWKTDRFSWDGKAFKIPERNVIPKPVQKPHPPLWLACTNPDTQRLAGERGLGSLCFIYGGFDDIVERLNIFREGQANQHDLFSEHVNKRFAFVTSALLDKDDQRARESHAARSDIGGQLFARYFSHKVGGTLRVTDRPRVKIDFEDIRSRRGSCVGDPQRVLDICHAYAEAGIDQVIFGFSPMVIPMDLIKQTMRLMAEYVLPEFRKERLAVSH
jgi:alkanesulfonate monooxygenase SsuD/methylene tetrahydromethanopterin reductase-like flavin-dependent oxidoreductase (luciferase family)